MELRKLLLVCGVLLIWIVSGNQAHTYATGRAAKILEEPIVPQTWGSHESSSTSNERTTIINEKNDDRSLTMENNMMLGRSVLTISLKLLMVYLIVRLFSYGLTSAGVIRPKHNHHQYSYLQQPIYTVDVNYNPAPAALATQTSYGAAAGASTGGGAGVVAPVAPSGGYLTAASTNQRPSFLFPHGPRFRFGGPRHPPRPRHPMHVPVPAALPPVTGAVNTVTHNMGEETHLVETHSHVYVLPDGTQGRIPLPTTTTIIRNPGKPGSSSSTTSQSQSQQASASSTEQVSKAASDSSSSASETNSSSSSSGGSTTEKSTQSVKVSTSSSSSSSAERRSSTNVFRDKQSSLHHQPYDDWSLHFNPGI